MKDKIQPHVLEILGFLIGMKPGFKISLGKLILPETKNKEKS
jgi:hypothetical protein